MCGSARRRSRWPPSGNRSRWTSLPKPRPKPSSKPAAAQSDRLVQRDNTFGTPEEDAFRRDFTINALFYDIATFSIIDYTGGLEDLRAGVIRSIGDPHGPVPGGSGADAARRDPGGAPRLRDRQAGGRRHRRPARRYRAERAPAADGRVLQAAALGRGGAGASHAGRAAAARADFKRPAGARRRQPVGVAGSRGRVPAAIRERARHADQRGVARLASGAAGPRSAGRSCSPRPATKTARSRGWRWACCRSRAATSSGCATSWRSSGAWPTPRCRRGLDGRSCTAGPFQEALTWMELHGHAPELVEHWRGFAEAARTYEGDAPAEQAPTRRRRRRRRGRRARPRPDVPE